MPSVILLFTVCLSVVIVGLDLMPVIAVFKPLSGSAFMLMAERFGSISKGRVMSTGPLLPYVVVALIAGVIEGLHWRTKQVWQGYHRGLWQLTLSPLVLATALLTSWVITLDEPGILRLWGICFLLVPVAFALVAGYKASTTR